MVCVSIFVWVVFFTMYFIFVHFMFLMDVTIMGGLSGQIILGVEIRRRRL